MDNNSQPTRRDFLGTSAAALILGRPRQQQFGYIKPSHKPTDKTFYQAASHLADFGKQKLALLHNAYKRVTGHPWNTRLQFMGDCVGCGIATAVDYLTVTETLQRRSSWQGNHSIVGIYVGGKELAGQRPTSSGARLEWLINFLAEYGSLLAKQYGPDDRRKWDPETYNRFTKGLTLNLKAHARQYPLVRYNRISSYPEARDAIASGHPVIIGSSMGVSGARRDKDGFFQPKGYTPHCMCCIGVEDKQRPSILIQNSHGPNWARGPKRYETDPNGSAWVDADIFDRYISEYDDSWTITYSKGYTVKRRYVLW